MEKKHQLLIVNIKKPYTQHKYPSEYYDNSINSD